MTIYSLQFLFFFVTRDETWHLRQEFLAATIDRNVFIREDNVRRAFQYFDVEGTGSITVANLVQIFGSEDHAREIVGVCDLFFSTVFFNTFFVLRVSCIGSFSLLLCFFVFFCVFCLFDRFCSLSLVCFSLCMYVFLSGCMCVCLSVICTHTYIYFEVYIYVNTMLTMLRMYQYTLWIP